MGVDISARILLEDSYGHYAVNAFDILINMSNQLRDLGKIAYIQKDFFIYKPCGQ